MVQMPESTSTRPYLIRALYEWCTDNGFTPYLAVLADETALVPREYVKNGEIVLNVSFDATSSLKLGNDFIEFKARFAGTARDILVPVDRVLAIYAKENGQGMAFPTPSASAGQSPGRPGSDAENSLLPLTTTSVPGRLMPVAQTPGARPGNDGPAPRPPTGRSGRPSLKRVK